MAENWQLKAVLSANSAGMVSALKSVNTMAKSTRKYLGDVASSAGHLSGKIGLPFAAISGILGGFSLVAVKNAVVGFTEMGEAVQKGALKAGMSVQQYQRMKYVAEQAGVGVEAMEGSLGKLNRQVGEAVAGKNQSLSSLMKHLGITMRDSNGQIRTGVDLLPQLADAFKRNESPAVRARMGMAMFGKSYAEMLPLLADGSDEIAKSLKRFDQIKGVLGPEEIGAAKQLGDEFKNLEMVMKGFQGIVAKNLIPVIQPLVVGLTDWWIVNKKLVSVEVGKMAKDLGEWIKTIDFKKLADGVQSTLAGFGKFVDFVGGAKNALIGLVLFMNIQTIMALGSLVAALARAGLAFLGMAAKAYIASNASLVGMARVAVAAIATAGPIGAIGAAFAWVAGIAAGAGGIISGAMGVVAVAIRGVGVALMANPLGLILGLATAAFLIYENWGTLKEWFSSFFSWIGDKFKAVIGWAVDLAKTAGSFLGFGSSDSSGAAGSATTSAALATAAQPEARPATFNNRTPKPLWINPNADRPSLLAPQSKGRVDGQVNININGLPPGSRVEQVASGGDMPLNLNAGIRSYATGMPY